MNSSEDYGPRGDPARHLPLEQIEAAWKVFQAPPTEAGRVALIVARRADGIRDALDRVRLTPESGVPGDRWARSIPDRPDMQLAVIRRDVAELLANKQPITHAGDNLFVDLDLSTTNLPVGSRLRVGGAVVEVSPEPHNGCRKFMGRFGKDALRFISDERLRSVHLRGVYWTVVEAGEVSVGNPIEILSRGSGGRA